MESQKPVVIRIVVIKHISMLELCLINSNLQYHYYRAYYIIFFLDILLFYLLSYFLSKNIKYKSHDYDKYFSIATWRKSGGSYYGKAEKNQKNEKKEMLNSKL